MIEQYEKIYSDPTFQTLVRKKSIFSWCLAILTFVIYFSFILIIAFAPEIFAKPISSDSVISYGIPIGVGVILVSFLLTGVYVVRANKEFDGLNQDLLERYKTNSLD